MTDTDRLERATQSALRGAEAASLLAHPLFQEIIDGQIEVTTTALLALPVAANEDRLALCTVLNVLRRFKTNLESIRDTGAFDAKLVAQSAKERPNA